MKEDIYKIFSPPLISLPGAGIDMDKILWEPEVQLALAKANENYLHWEELRHKTWIPEKFFPTKEIFWSFLARYRMLNSRATPIVDVNDNGFRINIDSYAEFLHTIDKEMAGNFMGISDFSESNKKQFITRNLIEESIASSQLEGANTSRAVAKKMLLEGRKPHNHSEQMIVNNHQAMLKIEQEFYKKELSFELICELHAMITYQTLAKEKQGKLRETFDENGEKLKVIPSWSNTVTYITPDKEFVEKELPFLIYFANDQELKKHGFTHPLIKGIMLHFWIGLLHPFEDGNGRLARILFYWYMLKHEYWAFKYLSLSEKIKKSAKQYSMAYVYSEQEGCDLTYFIHYNIEKLKLARNEFQEYIKNKVSENRQVLHFNQGKYNFNDRQIKLLNYFHQEMQGRTNLSSYQQMYSVKKITAISDLKVLLEQGFLDKKKVGRNTYYYPTKVVGKFFQPV